MKITFKIVLLACCISLLGSCGQSQKHKTVEMTAANLSATPGGTDLAYQIINHSDMPVDYPAYYKIDRLEGEYWIPMPVNDQVAFIEVMYSLEPSDTSQPYSVSLYPERFEYPAGEYRIRKNILTGDQSTTLTAPFSLEGERAVLPVVSFRVQHDVYDGIPEQIAYTVINNTRESIEFGTYFEMERLVNLEWQRIPLADNTFFNDLAITPPPGESYTAEIYLQPDILEYPAGIYRLSKQVKAGDEEWTIYTHFRLGR